MSSAATTLPPPAARPLAPWLHTGVLIAFFLVLTAGGALFQGAARSHAGGVSTHPNVLPIYLSLLAGEWGLVLYVWKGGLRHRHTTILDVIGGAWPNAGAVLRDVALAAGLWGVWALFDMYSDRWMGADRAASIGSFLPQGAIEGLMWVLLSISAGFCEEFVFRGYLQKQFAAWTRSPWIALILQSALFGISHGYQGARACAKIAAFGLLFGVVAMWRRSLRPGMIAHAATDILAGLFRI